VLFTKGSQHQELNEQEYDLQVLWLQEANPYLTNDVGSH